MRKLLFASTVAIVGFLSGHAHAAQISSMPMIGNWNGAAYDDDRTHRFVGCTAFTTYHNGNGNDIAMFVSMNPVNAWSLGFMSNEWNLQKGTQIPVNILLDGKNPWSGSAIALAPNQVQIIMGPATYLAEAFRAAYQMSITAAGKAYTFNLDGTSRMMVALRQCVERQVAIERGETPNTASASVIVKNTPTPAPIAPPSAPVAPPTLAPQFELIAMRLASNLLLETKMSDAHLLSPDQSPPQLRGHGVVWASNIAMGSVVIVPGTDAQQVTTAVISGDANSCKGDFVSGRANELVDNTIVARSTTECRDSAGLHMHRYFTIPMGTANFIVFEIDHEGQAKPTIAPDSPLSDTNFEKAAVQVSYTK